MWFDEKVYLGSDPALVSSIIWLFYATTYVVLFLTWKLRGCIYITKKEKKYFGFFWCLGMCFYTVCSIWIGKNCKMATLILKLWLFLWNLFIKILCQIFITLYMPYLNFSKTKKASSRKFPQSIWNTLYLCTCLKYIQCVVIQSLQLCLKQTLK